MAKDLSPRAQNILEAYLKERSGQAEDGDVDAEDLMFDFVKESCESEDIREVLEIVDRAGFCRPAPSLASSLTTQDLEEVRLTTLRQLSRKLENGNQPYPLRPLVKTIANRRAQDKGRKATVHRKRERAARDEAALQGEGERSFTSRAVLKMQLGQAKSKLSASLAVVYRALENSTGNQSEDAREIGMEPREFYTKRDRIARLFRSIPGLRDK